MLLDLLKEKRCFKLILGAGNEDLNAIEKLVYIYSLAGCNLFDLCAKPEVIKAAKKGLKRAGVEEDRYICISVGTSDDIHFKKAEINQDKCLKCGRCKDVCIQDAILDYKIEEKRCIGCSRCQNVCPNDSICMKSNSKEFEEILPPLITLGINCIEFHIQGNNTDEIFEKWKYINDSYKGILSISIGNSYFGNKKIIEILTKMLGMRKPYTTIIQTDGIPMSGGYDDYKSTLQTVALAQIVQNANLPVYVMLSGGTNSKSTELAKMCNIEISAVAIGSYARKIVKEYTNKENFFENKEELKKALELAKNLVYTSFQKMK